MSKRLHFGNLIMPSVSTFRLVITAAFVLALISMTAAAQSGRRLPKSTPTPEPSPQPIPVAKPGEKPKPALKLIVGAEQRAYSSGLPSYFTGTVLKACAERLDSAPSVEVTVSHRDVNRGEAIKTAKAEKEAYVVWLQLGSDRTNYGGQIDINDLYLQYVVFAPMTAKIAANGRTYPQGYGRGGVIVNPGRFPGGNNLPYLEQALKQAARAAAERILDALIADIPGERAPG
jgi:hypothetical protein